jgi:superfamily II DNA or RNA helicase
LDSQNNSSVRDNRPAWGKVGDFLREKIKPGSDLSFVSAFFTIYAFEALKKELTQVKRLRFLFGEPQSVHTLDPEQAAVRQFQWRDEHLELSNQLEQKRIAKACAAWIRDKVDVRSINKQGFLHGKLYHLEHENQSEAILGSSNFTVRGLGLATTRNNIELNLEVNDKRDIKDLRRWFEEVWADQDLTQDVKAQVLEELDRLHRDNSPELIYYKTLFHLFEKYLEDDQSVDQRLGQTNLFSTGIWNALYEFQKDGAKGAINKILAHNGCIVADSVGLGKTFLALAVIKYFELKNERVLVLAPKKLRENWSVYRNNDTFNPFLEDRFRFDVLAHTDLSRSTGKSGEIDLGSINWGNYDLVVLDESHNFRNNKAAKYVSGEEPRKSRYQRLMDEIIRAGVRTKVLLLSATPVNNDLKDLRNQLALITGGDDQAFKKTLEIGNLKELLRQAQAQFTLWAKQPTEGRKTKDLLERLGADFFRLLDELTIARSRKHVTKHYLGALTALQGFPKRTKPETRTIEIDASGKFPSYDDLADQIRQYRLTLFRPSDYLKPEKRKELELALVVDQFTQSKREKALVAIMVTNFLKRLESSVHSFSETMARTVQKIEVLEEKIKRFQAGQELEASVEEDDQFVEESEEDEEIDPDLFVGKKLKYALKDLEVGRWLEDLKKDKQQLKNLNKLAADIDPSQDAKLQNLKGLIRDKAKSPSINKLGQPNRKVLVFTAFADTATYLYEHIGAWAKQELGIQCALVLGSGDNKTTFGGAKYQQILTNFSPRSKHRDQMKGVDQAKEIDLLIATDCISEGQNLQDCDLLVNYDIHWNPVRLIQRFGRIDRLGSVNEKVGLVNYWPTHHLDKYINLKHRVEARMALVDLAATAEDNLLESGEVEELISDELKYRDRQLLRLKDEVLDLEDLGGVGLNDFSLDDFRRDLMRYLQENKDRLRAVPDGAHAIAPMAPSATSPGPGIVFCLRHKGAVQGMDVLNPLHPYALIYMGQDGELRFGLRQPRAALELMRNLCEGKTEPLADLCKQFDERTQGGSQMDAEEKLMKKAVAAVKLGLRKSTAILLQSDRQAVLPFKKNSANEDTIFELVTWLSVVETKA